MSANFDKLIFLLSTDCFADQLFGEFAADEIEKVKHAAREAVPEIINGGDNYFMCADYSAGRIERTKEDFFARLRVAHVCDPIQKKVGLFYDALNNIGEGLKTAVFVIKSVALRLYYLSNHRLATTISDELIDLMAGVEPFGLELESCEFEWEDIWLNSPSQWDQYVMSLMDGVDEVPYLTFTVVTKFSSKLDFLRAWKKQLGEGRFKVVRQFILTEAHIELDKCDPPAAKEIGRVMSGI